MIELKNVSYFYNKGQENEVRALSNINLAIDKGQFVSIVGSNGSGKSTLAHLLNGLLKPSEGDVLIDELSTRNEDNLTEIRQRVGLLFQNPDNQIVATIVEEDIAFGPENLGLSREEIGSRIDSSLEAVAMEAYRRYEPHSLSAGQKQKVAIASILAMKPSCMVLDEPTSYLDPSSRKEMMQFLSELNRSQRITVLNITHYSEQILYGDRVIAMDNGSIVFDGKVADFLDNEQVLRLTGLTQPIWLQIGKKYQKKWPSLARADSLKSLGDILCSLS